MIYGYCRCSTDDTKQDVKRQERELISMGVPSENIYLEYAHATDVKNRTEFKRLLKTLSAGDTLVATELSRITRSTKDLIEILEYAKQTQIKLILGSFTVDCTADELDPMTEGMLKMMAVFAELERNIISQRVKSGMAHAKAKGSKIGRPYLTQESIPDKFWKYYKLYCNNQINITDFSKMLNCSRTTIYKYISIIEKDIKR